MKFFHTADWHLGKLIQSVYMTEDQRYILQQFICAIEEEKPDAVIIAGDLYDRAVPPVEAVRLLDEVFETIVIDLGIPVLAIAGNHDGPDRIDFGNKMMESKGLFLVGQLNQNNKPVVLEDEFGEVHFHLVPYAEPGIVRYVFEDDEIRSHDDALKVITQNITQDMDKKARHVFVGHAFITATGEREEENTSDSERPLAIGGAEHVKAGYFKEFDYTALGHLHKAHKVGDEKIRYAGSPLKYSISEENHQKGFLIVDLDQDGNTTIEKRLLVPKRDMRTVEGYIEEIEKHPINEDYVFVRLLDESPVLFPMERIRTVYPNAMHVERKMSMRELNNIDETKQARRQMDELSLFKSFYKEVNGQELTKQKEDLFAEIVSEAFKSGGDSQ